MSSDAPRNSLYLIPHTHWEGAVFQTVSGTEDTGGGGNDFLFATWLPPEE